MTTEIKNLKKAADRILKAIKLKEKIIIYGDADLDGVTSVIILEETIKNLSTIYNRQRARSRRACSHVSSERTDYIKRGVSLFLYFPDREKDGYGINEEALFYLKKYAPALFLALDCGIGNFKEVKTAKKLGFEVIIIDHHEVLDKLPQASIIVDPKQKQDNYPFKQLATVGIIFRLSKLLLKEKMTESLRKNFLELTAMATIADMMPRVGENEEMIIEGLDSLKTSWRPGIQVLFELEPLGSLTLLQQVNKINSILNIRNIEGNLPAAFRLLTASKKEEAEKLAKILLKQGLQKKVRIREIMEEVEERISKEKGVIVFEGSDKWELILLGVVASILSQKHQRPIFLYKKGKEESQSSIRAPAGFNIVEAMKSCSKNLLTYGGHPRAAGFRIKNKELEDFKKCLIEYFNNK